ncbi:MAG: ATP synthase F1 subunit delta [Planctomycetota bacterium]|nr:MAG: ATP synthase F1 subunit delta [Planctomycetota bacterium]
MSDHAGQVDAVARVYARSLFEVAEARGGRGAIEETMDELEAISELARQDRGFAEFLSSAIIPAPRRAASLRAILGGRVSDPTLNFLLVLNEKGRLGRFESIVSAFDELVQERFGRVEVDVWTAAPIDAALRDRLAGRLRDILKREPVVHAYTDPSMIGGIRLQVGDQMIDGSVATRLRRLGERLAADGGAEVRAHVERFVEDG